MERGVAYAECSVRPLLTASLQSQSSASVPYSSQAACRCSCGWLLHHALWLLLLLLQCMCHAGRAGAFTLVLALMFLLVAFMSGCLHVLESYEMVCAP